MILTKHSGVKAIYGQKKLNQFWSYLGMFEEIPRKNNLI